MPVIVALLILWFIATWLYESHPIALSLIVSTFVAVTVLLVSATRKAKREQQALAEESENYRRQAWNEACAITEQHLPVLAKKFGQTIYQDDYGNEVTDRWLAEIEYFIENVVAKNKKISELLLVNPVSGRARLVDEIDRRARSYFEAFEAHDEFDAMSPLGYEAYIKGLLEQNGWEATLTAASGDQGIDIKATLRGITAVFQCKKYSRPVGNSAVQEIIAGREFEKAHLAAVVSNAGYTTSAKQLASSADVRLLHHSEIQGFTALLLDTLSQQGMATTQSGDWAVVTPN